MNPKLQGPVTLTFIRGGISKNGKPYLQCSNGRAEIWINIPSNAGVTDDTFNAYQEDGDISMVVEVTVGSDQVKFVRLGE